MGQERAACDLDAVAAEAQAAQRAGRLDEARRLYDRVLEASPHDLGALMNLAALARQAGDNEAAVALLRRAEAVPGSDAATLAFNLGNALRDLGRTAAAETTWRRLLDEIAPQHRGAMTNLGLLLKDSGRAEEALDLLGQALRQGPENAAAWLNYGLALLELDRPEAAITAFERALDLAPGSRPIRCHLALSLKRLGRLDEAFAVLAPAMQAGAGLPDSATLTAYANLLTVAGQETAGLRLFQQALAADPGNSDAHLGRASALLRLGRFGPGFAAFEQRFASKVARSRLPGQRWQGDGLPQAELVVTPEQGLGDVLQYLRFLPAAQARVGKLTLVVPAPLLRLCQGLPGCDRVIAQQDIAEAASAELQCSLPSLPLALGLKHPGEVPPPPYLPVPPRRGNQGAKTIGFAWSGNPANPIDRLRSLHVRELAPLFSLPGTRCVSLQVGAPAIEIEDSGFAGLLENWSGRIEDLADTARLLGEVDLVVSADTALAHLAGALDMPVLLLGCLGSDWRWRVTHEGRNAWYPKTEILWRQGNEPWIDAVRRARPLLMAMLER